MTDKIDFNSPPVRYIFEPADPVTDELPESLIEQLENSQIRYMEGFGYVEVIE